MADMQDTTIIQGLHVAFSRPQESGAVKQYVQNVLKTNAEDVKRILTQNNG